MNFTVKVLKFGGSSVESIPALHKVASLIKKQLEPHEKIVVVVSAMGASTDELLKTAFSVSENPPQRELDMLVSTGERVSGALLSMALHRLNVKAISLTGSQCGILTNEVHQHAEIIDIKCDRILTSFEHYDVVVVAGFQGVDPKSKEITTLGRGGSDLTAVALADKLGATICSIYTDVDGILTLDPKLFQRARTVPRLSWATAYKLSCAGAKVLHYRAASLALKKKVPLIILNTKNPEGPKTFVESKEDKAYFIIPKKAQSLIQITITGKSSHESFFSALLQALWKFDGVPSIVKKEIKEDKSSQFRFVVNSDRVDKILEFLESKVSSLKAEFKELEKDFTSLSLIYSNKNEKDVASELENCFGNEKPLFLFEEEGHISFGFKEPSIEPLVERISQKFSMKE